MLVLQGDLQQFLEFRATNTICHDTLVVYAGECIVPAQLYIVCILSTSDDVMGVQS